MASPGFGDHMVLVFLCVRNFSIEYVRFLDTCSNKTSINNFELFAFMNELMHDDGFGEFFVLVETIQYKDF